MSLLAADAGLYLPGMVNWHVRREARPWEALELFQQAVVTRLRTTAPAPDPSFHPE